MQELYKDKLRLIERQQGQSYAAQHRREEHAYYQAVKYRHLCNQIADGMHVEAAAVIQYYVLDVLVLDELLGHPVGYESSECLSYEHHKNILLDRVETQGDQKFHVSHVENTQTVPEGDERGVEKNPDEAAVCDRRQNPEEFSEEINDIGFATGLELGDSKNH